MAAGIAAEQLFGPLTVLELAGLVIRQEGRWKIAPR